MLSKLPLSSKLRLTGYCRATYCGSTYEVVGTGIAFNLLSSNYIPVWGGCLITSVDTLSFLAIQVWGDPNPNPNPNPNPDPNPNPNPDPDPDPELPGHPGVG